MLKRLVPFAGMVTIVATSFAVQPAGAQVPQAPVADVVSTLGTVLDTAQPGFDALAPVTDQLEPALAQAIAALQPVIDQLNGVLDQAEPACAVLRPVLTAAQPVIGQVQPLIDATANPPEQLAFLSPVLTQVHGLVQKVLGLCAEAPAPSAELARGAAAGTTAPPSLPHTGGPLLAIPALGALGVGAALRALRRRAAD